MSKTTIQEKVFKLQRELDFLKKAFIEKPDFDIDEKIWGELEPAAKQIRKKLYKSRYGKRQNIPR